MEALTSMKTEVSPALGATGYSLGVTAPANFCGSRNIVVKGESLLRLYDGNAVAPLRGQDQWLDDLGLMNGLIAVMLHEAGGAKEQVVFGAHFYQCLAANNVEEAYKQAEKMPGKKWIIPIHSRGHWFLVVIEFEKKALTTVGFLLNKSPSTISNIKSLVERVCGNSDWESWTETDDEAIPKQTNGDDSGVLMLKAVERELKGSDLPIDLDKTKEYHKEFYSLLINSPISEKNPGPVPFKAAEKETSNSSTDQLSVSCNEPKPPEPSSPPDDCSYETADYISMVDSLAESLKDGLSSDDQELTAEAKKMILEFVNSAGLLAIHTPEASSSAANPSERRRWDKPIIAQASAGSTQEQTQSGDDDERCRTLQKQGLSASIAVLHSDKTESSSSMPAISADLNKTTSVIAQAEEEAELNSTGGKLKVENESDKEMEGHSYLVQKPFAARVSAVSAASAVEPGKNEVISSIPIIPESASDDNSVEASSEIAKPPSQRESVDTAGEDKSSSPKPSCEVQNEVHEDQSAVAILTGNGMEPLQGQKSVSNDIQNHTTPPLLPLLQSERNQQLSVDSEVGETNSHITEETNLKNDGESLVEKTLPCIAETSSISICGNMLHKIFSKEATHAIENLFIHSTELESTNGLRDVINRCKKIMFEDPHPNLKVFFSILIEMFRNKKKHFICPQCLNKKVDRLNGTNSKHPKCHIIPRCLLEVFWDIHCEVHLKDFIYIQVSNEFKTADSFRYQMFCLICENSASKDEKLLCQYYLRITGAQESKENAPMRTPEFAASNAPENTVHMPLEHAQKVKHILAVIFFRCMLLGVNILDGYEDLFWSAFNSLREFCCLTNVEDYKDHPLLSKFHVFILDNKAYSKQHSRFSHILDFQLRNPQLTRMVKIDDDNVFLYMKFDSFHCILLIKWSNDIQFDSKNFFHPFPDFLWKYNLAQIGSLCQDMVQLEKSCKAFIHDPLVSITISKELNSLPLPPSVNIVITTSDNQINTLNEDEIERLRINARDRSPIAALSLKTSCDYSKLKDEYIKSERNLKKFQSSSDIKTKERLRHSNEKHKRSLDDVKKTFERQQTDMNRKLNTKCSQLEGRIKRLEDKAEN